jgi:hypothetical protein
MRKLASIRRIDEITPIENADLISCARIEGWEVVVKKGEFKVGDLCVYCEIDSILPDREEFEFLRPRKFRIKTLKLKNQVSQGIIFPLSILGDKSYKEGTDVTEILGVKKYDPEEESIAIVEKEPVFKGSFLKRNFRKYTWKLKKLIKNILGIKPPNDDFPSFIHKTDEARVQNCAKALFELQGSDMYITEKAEGCLSENSVLETEHGFKTIKYICDSKYKGKIKSYNTDTHQIVFSKIINHFIYENKNDWYEIELVDGSIIKITGNHKVWLPELLCWRSVEDLNGTESFLID